MARKYYAVYYGDGKGKIFTRLKDFQRATAKKSAKLYRGFGVKLEAELWLKNPAEFPKEKRFFAVKVGIKPGIYDNLEEYEAQMKGYPHCLGKVFYTIDGAKYWLEHEDEQVPPPKKQNTLIDRLKRRLQGFFTSLFWAISKRWQLRSILQNLAEKSNPWVFCRINTSHKLIIYTDASFHEGGRAGYAAVILDTVTGAEFYVGGSSDDIANSTRAELYAIISAVRLIDEHCKATLEIRTDAISLVQVAKPHNLRRLNKLGFGEQFCTNGDLWREFYRLTIQRDIQVVWVRGHFRDKYNKLCDNIAGRCSIGD